MKKKMVFTSKTCEEIIKFNRNGVLNFQNFYSVYLFNKEIIYRRAVTSPENFIFPDGRVLSFLLRTKQRRGPTFTKDFLENKLDKKQRHFFILSKIEDFNQLKRKFPKLKNVEAYSPPYIKQLKFSDKEIEKIVKQLRQFEPDYIWVCIGNPKQEILANQLYKKHKAFYFNIGAAIDFLLEKKMESPKFLKNIGMEWFYRLITDFKHSKKKVWRSFLGLKYLNTLDVEK